MLINKTIAPTKDDLRQLLLREAKLFDEDSQQLGTACLPRALIIDGPSLITAMEPVVHGISIYNI